MGGERGGIKVCVDWNTAGDIIFGGVITVGVAAFCQHKANKDLKEQVELLIKQSKQILDFIKFVEEGLKPFYYKCGDGTYKPVFRQEFVVDNIRKVVSGDER